MFMQILRSIVSIVLFLILIPIKILVTLCAIVYAICARISCGLTFRESWERFCEGDKKGLKQQMCWIKTGKLH